MTAAKKIAQKRLTLLQQWYRIWMQVTLVNPYLHG